jgi:hypothetical protein
MLIETIKLKDNKVLEIFQTGDDFSPREWDNLSQLVCFHKRYKLGDKHNIDHRDYSSFEEMIESNTNPDDIVLSLYLYDHSGISISSSPFSCRFDSGQIGYAVVTKEKIIQEYGDDSPANRERALNVMLGEITTYDQYLQGDIYSFELYEVKTCDQGHEHKELIDSCGGFYGSDFKNNGLFEHAGIDTKQIA